jgi:hypothetical protein
MFLAKGIKLIDFLRRQKMMYYNSDKALLFSSVKRSRFLSISKKYCIIAETSWEKRPYINRVIAIMHAFVDYPFAEY